jgi:TIR domain
MAKCGCIIRTNQTIFLKQNLAGAEQEMPGFDVFISHSSKNKELARFAYYNAISNGLRPWFDEALFKFGDDMRPVIRQAIEDSGAYLLFYSKEATREKSWVPFEMEVAIEKKERDANFRIIVVKLDDHALSEWWQQYLYTKWDSSDAPGSVIRLIEALLNKKIFPGITGAAFLTSAPASVFENQSASLAEHTRNYILYYLAHIKGLLQAIAVAGHAAEHQDTLTKLLNLSLLAQLPTIRGGWMTPAPGVYEFIHANRMRIPPRVTVHGLPDHYVWKSLLNDEISTRISRSPHR